MGFGVGDIIREIEKVSFGVGVVENERARGGLVGGRGSLYV